jgi:type I restriction enzyme R subunit
LSNFTESVVEDAALAWLESLGYAIKHGPEIAPGEFPAERAAADIRNFRITARESERNYRGLLGGSKKNTITSSS